MKTDQNIRKIALGGVMAALIFVTTYLPRIPVPITNGYIHLGDGMIFLATMLLGSAAIPAAAIGSMLSDLAGGYMHYLVPTFLIKGLMALAVWLILRRKNTSATALLAFVAAELIMVAGYFCFKTITSGAMVAAGAVVPNLIQGIAGVVVGMLCRMVVPRLKIMIQKD